MNTPKVPAQVDSSNTWGKTPVNPIQITQAFSNDPADRQYQDVGFDGLDDNAERIKKNYILQKLASNFGTSSLVYQKALTDPASDNYKWYRDNSFDAPGTGILGRYKNHNNPQGNSPEVKSLICILIACSFCCRFTPLLLSSCTRSTPGGIK